MNISGSSFETYILRISLIILGTKMLESWCNSLPGKQIYEYLGQQAAGERWSIWQPAKYALLQLPNKLRISFPNLEYSFLIKKIPLTCFFVYEEVDRLSMVEKLSIKWYFHSDATHLFSRIHIFSIQWNTSEVLVKNDQDGMVECWRYIFSHSIHFIKVQHFLLCEEETWELVPRLLSHSISWSAPSSRETLTEIRSGCLALGTTRPGPQWTVFSCSHGDPFERGQSIDIYSWWPIWESSIYWYKLI